MTQKILLLGIYPEETIIEKTHVPPLFIVALFTIARTWKQPRCPSTDEWVKNLWYIMGFQCVIHNGILLSHKKASESVLMRWMNLEPIIQSEVS